MFPRRNSCGCPGAIFAMQACVNDCTTKLCTVRIARVMVGVLAVSLPKRSSGLFPVVFYMAAGDATSILFRFDKALALGWYVFRWTKLSIPQ